ncbi:MAG: DNA/RNA nuclease SfsA [Armatimonadetes bacterium]|nr:DNA/RNA nuclease SfsA [Armatimonadota bacterium]
MLVRCGRRWVCVDARLPPRLLAEALTGPRGIEPFGRCAEPVFEPPLGEGRADLAIACAGTTWIVETKCVTLAHDGVALFPDAPTERGRRHLAHLAALTSTGSLRPAVAFICQRPDVYCFQPNADTDPLFSKALAEAARSGVLVAAYRCNVNTRGIAIAEQIPAYLGGDER